MKTFLKAILLGAMFVGATSPALAQPSKKASKKAAHQQAAKTDADDDIDVSKSTVVEMDCALGDKITLYRNAEDEQHIGMRWKKHLVRLAQVPTSTGAQRYESHKHGLVWIGIPAKGMLLDSKKGQQLANECRTQEQVAAAKNQPAPQPQFFADAKK